MPIVLVLLEVTQEVQETSITQEVKVVMLQADAVVLSEI